jgi:hypothetical protein
MGRVKNRKRDGGEIEAFIVDEDRDTYVFRWNLSKADEFRMKRSDIFQISRLEPSSLKPEIMKDRVNLTWEPPYSKIREYRIYIRSGNEKYVLAAVTENEKCTLFGLREKVPYTVMVRAVDISGSESEPSNEVSITLTDMKPQPPTSLTCDTLKSSDGNSLTAKLRWINDAGKKNTYRIYKQTPDGDILSGETKENEYTVYALSSVGIHAFYITAADSKGNTSDRSRIVYTKGMIKPEITAGGSFLIPFGRLGEMVSYGYGVTLSYDAENFLRNFFRISFKTGMNYFTPRSGMFDYILIFPFTCSAGYSFNINPDFYITPEFGAGISYNIIRYDKGYKSSADVAEYSSSSSIRPVLNPSVSIAWRAYTDFEFKFLIEYMVISDSSLYHFASASAAGSYRF